MKREAVRTAGAPAAIGPYSQAVRTGGFLFCSGQIPLDPSTGKIVEGGIEAQTERVLSNLEAVLIAGGGDAPVGREDHRLPCRSGGFPGDERGLRKVLSGGPAGAGDGSGRQAARGRARRDRCDRHGRVTAAGQTALTTRPDLMHAVQAWM